MPLRHQFPPYAVLLFGGCLAADPVPTIPPPSENPDAPAGWIYYDQAPDTAPGEHIIWRVRGDGTGAERVIGPTPYYLGEGFDALPGGRQLAAIYGSALYIWPPGQTVPSFRLGTTNPFGPPRWSPDWRSILTTGLGGAPARWRLTLVSAIGTPDRELASHDGRLEVAGWYATGDSAVVLFEGQGAQVVRLDGSRRPLSALFDNREVQSVAPSGQRALLIGPPTGPAGRDRRWRVQDPSSGTLIWDRTLRGRPRGVAWSLDERYLAIVHESELPELPGAILYRIDLTTGALRILVPGPGVGGHPRWVAD